MATCVKQSLASPCLSTVLFCLIESSYQPYEKGIIIIIIVISN